MICEDCNFYTEEYDFNTKDNEPFCNKLKKKIEINGCCKDFCNDINCYDCQERYEIYYEIDDIDHYCKKHNVLLYRQTRSVLFRGDFEKKVCK